MYAFGEGRAPFCVDCALATSGGTSRERLPFDRMPLDRTAELG